LGQHQSYDENNSFKGEAKFESKKEAEIYLKSYKDRINKYMNAAGGKAKTRLKLQVFEMDGKSMIEEKKRKYGHYHHHISAIS
jgi:ssDNA-binding replication factor A large subunit